MLTFSCVEVFFGEKDGFVAFGGGIDPINRSLGLKGLAGITVEFRVASNGGEKIRQVGLVGRQVQIARKLETLGSRRGVGSDDDESGATVGPAKCSLVLKSKMPLLLRTSSRMQF